MSEDRRDLFVCEYMSWPGEAGRLIEVRPASPEIAEAYWSGRIGSALGMIGPDGMGRTRSYQIVEGIGIHV